jgi:hypothetical protein
MSGTISLSPTVRWSAASWLFDWVLTALADTVEDTELAADLTGVAGENIGWLDLNDLATDQKAAVRQILRDGLRSTAERSFPDAMPGREEVLAHLDELSRRASNTS